MSIDESTFEWRVGTGPRVTVSPGHIVACSCDWRLGTTGGSSTAELYKRHHLKLVHGIEDGQMALEVDGG